MESQKGETRRAGQANTRQITPKNTCTHKWDATRLPASVRERERERERDRTAKD